MAGVAVRVDGYQSLLKNIRVLEKSVQRKIEIGLARAAILVFRASQKLVPVQFGFLKGSGFIRPGAVDNSGIRATDVGYTSAYALYVHEILENAHGAVFNIKHAKEIAAANRGWKKAKVRSGMFKRGENQQAKFLEAPLRNMQRELMDEILKTAKLTKEDLQ